MQNKAKSAITIDRRHTDIRQEERERVMVRDHIQT